MASCLQRLEQHQAYHNCCLCVWVGWSLLQIMWTSGYFWIHFGNHDLLEGRHQLCLLALDFTHGGYSLFRCPEMWPRPWAPSQLRSPWHVESRRKKINEDLVQQFPVKFWKTDHRGRTWSWMLPQASTQFHPAPRLDTAAAGQAIQASRKWCHSSPGPHAARPQISYQSETR